MRRAAMMWLGCSTLLLKFHNKHLWTDFVLFFLHTNTAPTNTWTHIHAYTTSILNHMHQHNNQSTLAQATSQKDQLYTDTVGKIKVLTEENQNLKQQVMEVSFLKKRKKKDCPLNKNICTVMYPTVLLIGVMQMDIIVFKKAQQHLLQDRKMSQHAISQWSNEFNKQKALVDQLMKTVSLSQTLSTSIYIAFLTLDFCLCSCMQFFIS